MYSIFKYQHSVCTRVLRLYVSNYLNFIPHGQGSEGQVTGTGQNDRCGLINEESSILSIKARICD